MRSVTTLALAACFATAIVASACSTTNSDAPAGAGAGTSGNAGVAGVSGSAGPAGASAGVSSGGATVGGGGSDGGGGASTGGNAAGGASGTDSSGGVGQAGTGGAAPNLFLLPAFTGSAAKPSTNLGTRNSGHEFTVTTDGLVVRELGVWDNGADGLAAAHVVTLFSLDKIGAGAKATPVAGGSVTVLAGSAAMLESGYRYAALPAPVKLAAGNYAVVAYGMNADDLSGDGGGLPLPATGISDANFDPFEYVSAQSPAFPSGGDQNAHANASLRFDSKLRPLRIMPLGASITDGYLGTMAGYRGPLKKLLDDAHVTFQFVGSWTDNPGTLPLAREQQHHEGHSGYVIQGGTSGRSGIYDFRNEWLGPTGSQADVILIVIGTNDVDLDYQLATAGQRLDLLIDAILDPTMGLQPSAKVILAQLPPINDTAEDVRCVSYNKTIAATVDAHAKKGQAITTVDLHSAITVSELADKLHPNDVGYGKVAKVFFDAIQKLNF